MKSLKKFFSALKVMFSKQKMIRLGLYGPPNGGKTTLANTIYKEIMNSDENFGEVSNIAHETRKIKVHQELLVSRSGKKIKFDLIDTPGIATRIDYEKFLKSGMSDKEAKQRAKEATRGVIESIKWLDNVDIVVVVLDSTKNPYNQVNLTIIGNLQARKIPTLIVANKTDLKSSKIEKFHKSFPKYKIVGISAKFSKNLDSFFDELFKIVWKKK